jgi:oxygen-independent coproporphyrinogen-3 oxidase
MAALVDEIRMVSASLGDTRLPVHTVFFGGGTPSLVPLRLLQGVTEALAQAFELQPGAEITLEANPGTLNQTYLGGLRKMGINRLSMGVQSADAQDLRILERNHDFLDVIHAVRDARAAGFTNINLDLIFGVPYQSLASWQTTLERALRLEPEHFSLYNLILEHGTPMNAWVKRGLLPSPDEDLAAEMYEWAMSRLQEAGFVQYEISNWARFHEDGHLLACRHNLQYWRNLPYLGLGAGAHGFAGGFRTANIRAPQAYIRRLSDARPMAFPRTAAVVNQNPIDLEVEMGETMMMGLRLLEEGVSAEVFQRRFNQGLAEVYGQPIDMLLANGLVEWFQGALRLTERGKMLGNQVFMQFV